MYQPFRLSSVSPLTLAGKFDLNNAMDFADRLSSKRVYVCSVQALHRLCTSSLLGLDKRCFRKVDRTEMEMEMEMEIACRLNRDLFHDYSLHLRLPSAIKRVPDR